MFFSRSYTKIYMKFEAALDLFSAKTVLTPDSLKCKFFFAGVDKDLKQNLLNLTVFKGSFPCAYLGVSLNMEVYHTRIVSRYLIKQ